MIVSNDGRILWYLRSRRRVHDLKTVTYRGRELLALYHRRAGRKSFYELRDRHYRVVKRITMGRPYGTDMHELQITPAGTAYLAAYHPVDVNGAGRVVDYVIREIDLDTGEVLFEWHSLDHVPVSASFIARPADGRVWDYFHGNSIEPPTPADPTIIVSSRNTSAVYGIDRASGRLHWTLGGKRDDFGLAEQRLEDVFCAQHDARRLSNGDVTMFDNGGSGKGAGTGCPIHEARVMQFRLDTRSRRARVIRAIPSRFAAATAGRPLFPIALGSARKDARGRTLVSWGTNGRATEVSRTGRVLHAMRIPGSTYRAVRSDWVGQPSGRPRIAAKRRGGTVEVWASWNGATEIARWHMVAGDSRSALADIGRPVAFADLETRLRARTRARFVAVRAIDRRGREIGRSRVVALR